MPLLLFAIALIIYAADQLSKNWVEANLPYGETVDVFGEFLQWHFARNPGAAFSMATGQTWIFTILAVVVVGVILWQIRKLRSVPWAIFLGLLLGGVLGNLTDRLIREPGFPQGHVVDFILTPWMWLGFNPAIYNVADIGIVVGMLLFIAVTLFGLRIEGGRHPRHPEIDESDQSKLSAGTEETEPSEASEASEEATDDTGETGDTRSTDGTP
ncbi:signal peptidase II [Leucobacter denitrificans]|uniref:Lipoprotein signal peptidase n=1 Tax=Leucobacter denitrificans TaxID=683042 RepID=A0A7G9S7N2_9MICO|nr:signal peptidase II [Leucobacter denitrificans]